MKLYSFYTPSHKIFADKWFFPSIKDNFELVIKQHKQIGEKGKYLEAGYNETMMHKIDLIIDAILQNKGRVFIYSDVDVQFFPRFFSDSVLKPDR
jgi:hypothetical protein